MTAMSQKTLYLKHKWFGNAVLVFPGILPSDVRKGVDTEDGGGEVSLATYGSV